MLVEVLVRDLAKSYPKIPHFFKSSSVGVKLTLKGGWTTLSLRPFKRSSMSRVASPLQPYVPKVAHFFPFILTLNITSIISQTGRSTSPFIVDEPNKTPSADSISHLINSGDTLAASNNLTSVFIIDAPLATASAIFFVFPYMEA